MSISIIIPTYNRSKALITTLNAYKKQSVPCYCFEVIIIDDGSDIKVADCIKKRSYNFKIHIIRQKHSGPAAARNLGFKKAKKQIILFTGDDMVPERDFLKHHIETHKTHKKKTIAVLGKIIWPPKKKITPFMRYVTEIGGQQFSYFKIKKKYLNDYNFFYSSNISLKRDYLKKTKELFNTAFLKPAFEDIELGYRLVKKHALCIVYDDRAIAYHNHKINLPDFYKRNFDVGYALMFFCSLHPGVMQARIEGFTGLYLDYSSAMPKTLLKQYNQLKKKEITAKTLRSKEKIQKKMHDLFSYALVLALLSGMTYFLRIKKVRQCCI